MEVHQNGLTSREYPTNDQMRNTGYYGQSRGGVNNNQDTNQDNGYQNQYAQYGQPYYGPQNEEAYAGNTGYRNLPTASENMPYVAGYSENQQSGKEPSEIGYGGSIQLSNDQWHQDSKAEETGILAY